jgi:hypothetical protein
VVTIAVGSVMSGQHHGEPRRSCSSVGRGGSVRIHRTIASPVWQHSRYTEQLGARSRSVGAQKNYKVEVIQIIRGTSVVLMLGPFFQHASFF